ncbi:MAG: hypothetical protein ACI83P_001368 [Janthinobacterium sp.]|jgi:uncharacterized protein (TIGR00369 family)
MSSDAIPHPWHADAEVARARLAEPGAATLAQLRERSGLEFLQAIGEGTLPSIPIGQLMGFVPVEWEPGRMVFQGKPGAQHYNPLGNVHGGYAATLLDSCVGCAIHSMLPAGKGYTTLELKINYIRAISEKTGPVRAEGKVIHVGAQTGIAEGRLTDIHGKLYAFATTTCLIFPI